MPYPTNYDTYTPVAGTTLEASADHANMHNVAGSAIYGIEQAVGTTNMIGAFANAVASTDYALIANTSGTLRTAIANGTLNMAAGSISGAITGSGTINGITLGTPTIGSIAVPGTVNALGFSAAIAPGVGTITDSAGGTFTVNAQAAQIYYSAQGTAAGNRTIAAPVNASPYQQLTFAFKASGSANGTLVWNSIFRFSQNVGTATLGTGTTWNYYTYRYNLIDTKWDFMGQIINLI